MDFSHSSVRTGFMGHSPAAVLLAAAILLLSILQQVIGHQNFDNLWLFTVAERVLDGGAPYVDVIEANPPASFLIYLPSAALARLLGTSVEFMVCASLFAGGVGVILFAGRILRRADLLKPAEGGVWLNMGVFILLFLPGIHFAQREHVATLCLLPLLAVYGARAQGSPCSAVDAVAAGLLAGLTVAIKPHFALAAVFPLAFVMVRRRTPRPMFQAENWAIVVVVLAYGALLVWRYPAFFKMLPLLMDVYVPLRKAWRDLFLHPAFLIGVAMVCGVLLTGRKGRSSRVVQIPLFASLGFLVAFLLQGKGFPNHLAPGIWLASLAACLLAIPALAAFASKGEDAREWLDLRWPIILGFPLFACAAAFVGQVQLQFTKWEEHEGLRAAVHRRVQPQPRLMSASILFHVGYPVARQVGAVWVGRTNGLWITGYAQEMLAASGGDEAYRARLVAYIDRDARMFLEDVRAHQPDLILADDHAGTAMAMRHPDIAAALVDYAPLETVGDVVLWGRKP